MNNVAFLAVLHTADMLIAALQWSFMLTRKHKRVKTKRVNRVNFFFLYQVEHRPKKRENSKLLKIAF